MFILLYWYLSEISEYFVHECELTEVCHGTFASLSQIWWTRPTIASDVLIWWPETKGEWMTIGFDYRTHSHFRSLCKWTHCHLWIMPQKKVRTPYTFQKSFMLIRHGPLKVPANNSSQGSLVLVKKTTRCFLLLNLEVVTVQKLRRSLVSPLVDADVERKKKFNPNRLLFSSTLISFFHKIWA